MSPLSQNPDLEVTLRRGESLFIRDAGCLCALSGRLVTRPCAIGSTSEVQEEVEPKERVNDVNDEDAEETMQLLEVHLPEDSPVTKATTILTSPSPGILVRVPAPVGSEIRIREESLIGMTPGVRLLMPARAQQDPRGQDGQEGEEEEEEGEEGEEDTDDNELLTSYFLTLSCSSRVEEAQVQSEDSTTSQEYVILSAVGGSREFRVPEDDSIVVSSGHLLSYSFPGSLDQERTRVKVEPAQGPFAAESTSIPWPLIRIQGPATVMVQLQSLETMAYELERVQGSGQDSEDSEDSEGSEGSGEEEDSGECSDEDDQESEYETTEDF
jgi:hypothetical protein